MYPLHGESHHKPPLHCEASPLRQHSDRSDRRRWRHLYRRRWRRLQRDGGAASRLPAVGQDLPASTVRGHAGLVGALVAAVLEADHLLSFPEDILAEVPLVLVGHLDAQRRATESLLLRLKTETAVGQSGRASKSAALEGVIGADAIQIRSICI